jgi:hypothetical protein
MAGPPGAQHAHGLDEFLAGIGEGVRNLGRRGTRDLATDNPVSFEFAKLRGQHLFTDTQKKSAKFGEASRAEAQMPNGKDLPFAADGIDGCLHRAAVMIFHGLSRLTKMCVLPTGVL